MTIFQYCKSIIALTANKHPLPSSRQKSRPIVNVSEPLYFVTQLRTDRGNPHDIDNFINNNTEPSIKFTFAWTIKLYFKCTTFSIWKFIIFSRIGEKFLVFCLIEASGKLNAIMFSKNTYYPWYLSWISNTASNNSTFGTVT